MSTLTHEQLTLQEKFDADVYGSTRGLFETLLLRTFDRAKQGEDVSAEVGVLLENYNNASEGCQRMAGLHRRANNVVIAARQACDALNPPNNDEEAGALRTLQAVLAYTGKS